MNNSQQTQACVLKCVRLDDRLFSREHFERFWGSEQKNANAASVTRVVVDLVESWRMRPFLFSCWIMHDATCYNNVWRWRSTCVADAEAFSCHKRHVTQAVMSARNDEAKLTNGLSRHRRPVLRGCWPTCMEQTSTTASSRLLYHAFNSHC